MQSSAARIVVERGVLRWEDDRTSGGELPHQRRKEIVVLPIREHPSGGA